MALFPPGISPDRFRQLRRAINPHSVGTMLTGAVTSLIIAGQSNKHHRDSMDDAAPSIWPDRLQQIEQAVNRYTIASLLICAATSVVVFVWLCRRYPRRPNLLDDTEVLIPLLFHVFVASVPLSVGITYFGLPSVLAVQPEKVLGLDGGPAVWTA